ncbi:Nramp family divalent metal transporter [Brooklawnia cerclae]|uniref:Mn2+/Fe2+ NRAMP family transporter n=1 Tax=Brooklawnia cerclae TaxID=349934 RepID=A0ABX0SJA7_9ACTN|nr:Nramp family divalent metal transporter [Brooklawnia cerclae]NIH58004.1 Mn2+/Fe2+ NRAMP family transporter [Brooklawnia cerclae]
MSEITAKAPTAPTPKQTPQKNKALRMLALMGPGFVVGAWQFGPGNLVSAIQAGSRYNYGLVWVIAVSVVLMLTFADMSIRVGVRSSGSVVQTIKETLGKPFGVAAGLGVFGITLCFSVGNAIGAGQAISLIGSSLGIDTSGRSGPFTVAVVGTIVCTAVVVAIVFFRSAYKVIEKLILVIVAVMATSFVITAVVVKPDWGAAAAGLVPSVPASAGLLLIALVGTNFSLNAAFYAGYASKERGLRRDQYEETTLADTVPGIVAPGIMTALVICAAAAVFYGTEIKSGTEIASLAKVISFPGGPLIFSLGFFGAAFSAMVANATAGGTLLSDGLGKGNKVSSTSVRIGVLIVLAVGVAVTIATSGKNPVQMIILAQALTVLIAPLLGVLLFILGNNARLMGDLKNTWWQNVLGVIGLVVILLMDYQLITQEILAKL